MDPTETLSDALEVLRELQRDTGNTDCRTEAIGFLRDLADWLEKGGFPPDVSGGEN